MRYLLVAVILVVLSMSAWIARPTIYEDGSFVYAGQQWCLPFAICNEGD